jgi:hypothetical protein
MSTRDRKIGFYNFMLVKTPNGEYFFNKELFKDLLNYIDNLPEPDKLIRNDKKK